MSNLFQGTPNHVAQQRFRVRTSTCCNATRDMTDSDQTDRQCKTHTTCIFSNAIATAMTSEDRDTTMDDALHRPCHSMTNPIVNRCTASDGDNNQPTEYHSTLTWYRKCSARKCERALAHPCVLSTPWLSYQIHLKDMTIPMCFHRPK